MQITVDLMDLFLSLLILVGVTAGVFLIISLVHLIRTLKRVSRLVADLSDPVTQSAKQLPGLIQKADSMVGDASVIVKSANETVPSILSDAKTITGTARAGVEAVGSAAESVKSGVSSLFGSTSEPSGNLGSIIGMISQILQIVGLFTQRGKKKQPKASSVFGRGNKRRR